MKIYAYCRVSTMRQSLQRQIENISKQYPNATFYTDKFTGSTLDRPAWNKLYARLQEGDTVVFDSVSRLSRDAESGATLYQELYEKGVTLIFLNEPHCNTDTYRQAAQASIPATGNEIADVYIEATNKALMILARRQIEIAFEQAEKERIDICQRVKDGMAAAKITAAANGEVKTYGAKPGVKLTTKKSIHAKQQIQKYSRDFNGTLTDADCMKLIGVSRNSFYKYKAALRAEGGTEDESDAGTD